MKAEFSPHSFGIIGLGRFGTALALGLAKAGKEVVVLDIDSAKLDAVKDSIVHVYPVESITMEVLKETGISHCGTVVVCIGKDVESNILATLNVLELHVPRVISKASSEAHGKVLAKLGAEVVYPESEMGSRLARSLSSRGTLDYLELGSDVSIVEIAISAVFSNKTLMESNLRKKYGVNVIAISHEGCTSVAITPETSLMEHDIVTIVGTNEAIARFEKANGKD